MKLSVKLFFYDYNAPFEGVVPYFYQDVKGLVTIGVGNLVDPLFPGLKMRRPDGTLASEEEIRADWQRVKNDKNAARFGHTYAKGLTRLRMGDAGIRELVAKRVEFNIRHLRSRFELYDKWPADAQLGVHSLAWACGPGFRFPKLSEALRARNFDLCAIESQISTVGNPGVRPRNEAHKVLFNNAARVHERGLDPDVLYYPERIGT